MINSNRRGRRGTRFASIGVVATMVVGLGLIATPALADDPPASFHPDQNGTTESIGRVLSDRNDGSDQLAHLTAVATADTTRVDWYACPVAVSDAGSPGGRQVTQAELPQCNVFIGSDPTPVTPTGGTLLDPADEAYEFFWDIRPDLDTQTRDILVLACIGSGTDIEGADANCRQSVEEDIVLDDAGGGTSGQTTAGEITQICTRDPDPGVIFPPGPEVCTVGGSGAGTRAEVDARFRDYNHGDPAPNGGFVIRATTSTDVGALAVLLDLGADADTEPQTDDIDIGCSTIDTFTTHLVWQCVIPQSSAPANQEFAIWISEESGGEAFCAGGPGAGGAGVLSNGDCTLDSHYSGAFARQATTLTQSFETTGGHTHQPPSPPAEAGCQQGETPAKSHSNESLGDNEVVETCVTDQFNDPIIGIAITEELTSPGNFTSAGCATRHDHDGDGRFEHCHGTTTGAGTFTSTVSNFNNTVGSTTITSCRETEPQTGSTPPSGHGCGNETLRDTLTLSWATTPSEVFLAYAGTASNTNDPCRTGATIAKGTVGQVEQLVVCTFDSQGNPVSTQVDASRLQWTIVGAHGNDQPSVRFNGSPPTETGSNAQATLDFTDIGPGDNFITVFLLDDNGNRVDEFFVEKDVAGAGGQAPDCSDEKKRLRKLRKKLHRAIKRDAPRQKIRKLRKKVRRARRAYRNCLRG